MLTNNYSSTLIAGNPVNVPNPTIVLTIECLRMIVIMVAFRHHVGCCCRFGRSARLHLFIYLTTIKHSYRLHHANISMKKNNSFHEQRLKALTCKAMDSPSSCKSYYIQMYIIKKQKKIKNITKTLINDKNTKMRITYSSSSVVAV